MSDVLQVRDEGGARILTLNRPDRLNALNAELRAEIAKTMRAAAADDSVRAVIVTGAGDRAFCSGQDLNEAKSVGSDAAEAWQRDWGDFYMSFLDCRKPVIAAINGVAAGGAFVICLLADVRIMADKSRFIMAEIDVGLPSIVGAYLLRTHLYLSRAIEITLTGRDIPAAEAKEIGLAHEVVPAGKVMETALAFAEEFAAKAPTPLRLTVGRMRDRVKRDFDELTDALIRYQSEAVASGEPKQVMDAFLAERAARKKAG
ncbi:MAG: enoyl-CoA hydratase/isomerase family protein [Rhodospirillaceae bacterium]|jgi:enoyl-CoA hydratase|nr:enoyl-CoA hydratase/isomerase family protein [Rhodospirillaceae bacterium]MBT6118182.1 enoyl-CoA hydratase/isomerase family protein [Rhodospirillaceae bacterium]